MTNQRDRLDHALEDAQFALHFFETLINTSSPEHADRQHWISERMYWKKEHEQILEQRNALDALPADQG